MGIGGIYFGFKTFNCLEQPKELNEFYRESNKINGLHVYEKIQEQT